MIVTIVIGVFAVAVSALIVRLWLGARAKAVAVSPLGKPLRADPEALGARIEQLAKDLTKIAATSEDIAKQARERPIQ